MPLVLPLLPGTYFASHFANKQELQKICTGVRVCVAESVRRVGRPACKGNCEYSRSLLSHIYLYTNFIVCVYVYMCIMMCMLLYIYIYINMYIQRRVPV